TPPADIREALLWAFHCAGQQIPPSIVTDGGQVWNADPQAWSLSQHYADVWPILEKSVAAGWSYAQAQLVMYQEAAAIKSHSRPQCGFDRRCGRCGAEARVNYSQTHLRTYCRAFQGVDQEADYEEWDTDSLRERAEVVWEFDRAVDEAIANFVEFCRTFRVEEQTILVPQ